MTNRFLAAVAFSAFAISVLALFVALSVPGGQQAPAAGGAATTTTEADNGEPAAASSTTTPRTTTAPAIPTTSAADASANTAPATASTSTEATEPTLPGTRATLGPEAGTQLGVIGVFHEDWLNVRAVPNGEVVATLSLRLSIGGAGPEESAIIVRDPASGDMLASLSAVGVIATGHTRNLATSTWHEIKAGPITGWASASFLGPLSPTTAFNATERVSDRLGESPTAPSLTELAELVAGVFASEEPASRIRITAPPGFWEGGTIAVDVVGQPDDSIRGYRLVIDAIPAGDLGSVLAEGGDDAQAGPYTLRYVGATPLCYSYRGVSADGICN